MNEEVTMNREDAPANARNPITARTVVLVMTWAVRIIVALAAGSALAAENPPELLDRCLNSTGMQVHGDRPSDQVVGIGVLAKRGQQRCLKKWGPTAEYLTSQIPGHSFKIVPLNFAEVYLSAEREEVDFILANSSFYVRLERLHGANRIVTLRNAYLDNAYTVFGGVLF